MPALENMWAPQGVRVFYIFPSFDIEMNQLFWNSLSLITGYFLRSDNLRQAVKTDVETKKADLEARVERGFIVLNSNVFFAINTWKHKRIRKAKRVALQTASDSDKAGSKIYSQCTC